MKIHMIGHFNLPMCSVDYKNATMALTNEVHKVTCITCKRLLARKRAA